MVLSSYSACYPEIERFDNRGRSAHMSSDVDSNWFGYHQCYVDNSGRR